MPVSFRAFEVRGSMQRRRLAQGVNGRRGMKTFLVALDASLRATMVVDTAIHRAATEHTADVIFIGSHGYCGLDRLLGTTAAKVVNHATCSVFVVRAPL